MSISKIIGQVLATLKDGPQLDAFNRLRTSDTGQPGDFEFIYDKQPLLFDEVTSGGATVAHQANGRDLLMSIVNTTNGTTATVSSHYDIPYTAGNSQLGEITGTLDNAAIGGGTAFLFIRSKVTGSVVETTYQQSAWNKNTAASVDWKYSQIFGLDFQSLKIGRIRFYLVRNGLATIVHEIYNDNVRSTGYWQTPTLPVFWRIYNDATYTYMEIGYGDTDNAIGLRYRIAANASATMRAICGTVKSEGGFDLFDMPGFPFGISNRTTLVTVANSLIPVLSIRPAATFGGYTNRMLGILTNLSVQTDNPINYRVFYRPTLTGPSWAAVDAQSGMEYDVSASAISGGILIEDDYATTSKNAPATRDIPLGRIIMSLGRTGTADILSIAAIRTTSTSASVGIALKWKEIR